MQAGPCIRCSQLLLYSCATTILWEVCLKKLADSVMVLPDRGFAVAFLLRNALQMLMRLISTNSRTPTPYQRALEIVMHIKGSAC